MLKIIEYSLLAVSLLVVIGLITSGSRTRPDTPATQDPADPKENGEAHNPGKNA